MQELSMYPYKFYLGRSANDQDKWLIDVYEDKKLTEPYEYIGTVVTDVEPSSMASTDTLTKKEPTQTVVQLVPEDIRRAFSSAVDRYEEEWMRECLDSCHEEVKVGYLTFSPSRIVEELDPIAFRCMIGDSSEEIAESYGEYEGEYEEDSE